MLDQRSSKIQPWVTETTWCLYRVDNYCHSSDLPTHVTLQDLTDCMAGDERIDAAEARSLAGLIERNDVRVMDAYKEYVDSQVRLVKSVVKIHSRKLQSILTVWYTQVSCMA